MAIVKYIDAVQLSGARFSVENLDTKEHPNAMPFSGVLLQLDQPSDLPPQGSNGHLIQVSSALAKERLNTLVGMGVDFRADMKGHDSGHKIGVITSAWIEGNAIHVAGVIYAKDFPDEAKMVHDNASRLGMSMEAAEIWVADADAEVWDLSDLKFTGAAILFKNSAAYQYTALAAAAAVEALGGIMEEKKNDGNAELAAAIGANVANTLKDVLARQNEILAEISTKLAAAKKKDDKEDEEDDEEASAVKAAKKAAKVKAAKKAKKQVPDPSADAEDDDNEDEDEEEGEVEAKKEVPEAFNEFKKKKGVKAAKIDAATETRIAALEAENASMKGKLDAQAAQIEAYSAQVRRKSITPEVGLILEQNGVNVSEMLAAGKEVKKLTVGAVDAMLANSGYAGDAKTRMHLKTMMFNAGIMEGGEVSR